VIVIGKQHKTLLMKVWAEIDVGIAPTVRRLQKIPGVLTHSSCQGTLHENGPHPYRPFVMVTWASLEAFDRVRKEFDVTLPKGSNMKWGYVHPTDDVKPGYRPNSRCQKKRDR
jgi:hypothetical protein